MNIHKFAMLYPEATVEESRLLTNHIKRCGLQNPITVLDGEILDGRNRFKACQTAGVTPDFIPYEGKVDDTSILLWVIGQNSHRRHLSTSQLAIVAASCAEIFKSDAIKRRNAGVSRGVADLTAILQQGTAAGLAAKTVGVSERIVADAIKIVKESPELAEKVRLGELKVNQAKSALPSEAKINRHLVNAQVGDELNYNTSQGSRPATIIAIDDKTVTIKTGKTDKSLKVLGLTVGTDTIRQNMSKAVREPEYVRSGHKWNQPIPERLLDFTEYDKSVKELRDWTKKNAPISSKRIIIATAGYGAGLGAKAVSSGEKIEFFDLQLRALTTEQAKSVIAFLETQIAG